MKRSGKRGFTIVELMTVLAVLTLVSLALVQTYSRLVGRARKSTAEQMVRALNTALAADGRKHDNMTQVLKLAAELGIEPLQLEANHILWDSRNDVFCYISDSGLVYLSKTRPVQAVEYWCVCSKMPEEQSYSIFWTGNTPFSGELKVGFDTDRGTHDWDLCYIGGEMPQEVYIHTNGGSLTIRSDDDVHHSGDAAAVVIEGTGIYRHWDGSVGTLSARGCRVEICASSTVAYMNAKNAASVNNNGCISHLVDTEQIDGNPPEAPTIWEISGTLNEKGGYYVLSEDQNFSESLEISQPSVIDLNGCSITFAEKSGMNIKADVTIMDSRGNGCIRGNIAAMKSLISVTEGSLTILGGEIRGTTVSKVASGVIVVKNGAHLTIRGGRIRSERRDAKIPHACIAVYIQGEGTSMEMSGGFLWADRNCALSNGGQKMEKGTRIEISGGKLCSPGDCAIYSQGNGVIRITGGEVEAESCIYLLYGDLVVEGGNFVATKEKTAFVHKPSQCLATGDCIIVDCYKERVPTADISNAMFRYQTGAKAVAGYVSGTAAPGRILLNGMPVAYE